MKILIFALVVAFSTTNAACGKFPNLFDKENKRPNKTRSLGLTLEGRSEMESYERLDRTDLPPLPPPDRPRRRLQMNPKFRLSVRPFEDLTGATGQLDKVIPTALKTELAKGGRFTLYERNGFERADAYVIGSLTEVKHEKACFDLRLANKKRDRILYSETFCMRYSRKDGAFVLDRSALKRIAATIEMIIPRSSEVGNVISVEGDMVFCDLGNKNNIKEGMVAQVYATKSDPKISDGLRKLVVRAAGISENHMMPALSKRIVVGMIYIFSVEQDYSVGILYDGDYVLTGETIAFK